MSGEYAKDTSSNSSRPRVTSGSMATEGSADCSSVSSSSNTRSAEATPDCSRFAMEPSWASGWVNCREYWMNACTSPSCIAPEATCRPPTTAIPT